MSKFLHSVAARIELIFLLSYVGGFSKNMCFCDQPHLEKTIHNNLFLKILNKLYVPTYSYSEVTCGQGARFALLNPLLVNHT